MKVIHIPFCFYPDSVGGTEVYVAGLAREQQRGGHTAVVCAPAPHDSNYVYEGVAVRRFAVDRDVVDVADLYGPGDARAALGFRKILDEEKPDVVHLHAFTRGASLKLIDQARRRGIPTVFSYHTPTVSCMRGTLLRDGTDVCDGALDTSACASCNLRSHGVGASFSKVLGRLPSVVGRLTGIAGTTGRIATALRMTELVEYRHATFRALMRDVDCVVALCDWTRDLLFRNGVPAGKVALSRQGISSDLLPISGNLSDKSRKSTHPSQELRIAFLGRFAPEKGVHVLIEALRRIPTAPLRLDLYGLTQSQSDEQYKRHLFTLAAGDERISFHQPLPIQEVSPALRSYDLLAAPSQWLETGPLVVMEAFAAGVPVIGSRLGGIAELVEHNVDGLLIEPKSIQEWASALAVLSGNRGLVGRLRDGIRPQRTMRDVAREIYAIYERVLSAQTRSVPVPVGSNG
jgi:glycosyltransferase involved in cell wall biosynthesis